MDLHRLCWQYDSLHLCNGSFINKVDIFKCRTALNAKWSWLINKPAGEKVFLKTTSCGGFYKHLERLFDHQHFKPQTCSTNKLNRQTHSRSFEKSKGGENHPGGPNRALTKQRKGYIYSDTHEHLDRASGRTGTSALHHMLLFLIGIRILTQNKYQYQYPTVVP